MAINRLHLPVITIVSAFQIAAGASIASDSVVAAVPEYRFEVGQELIYRGIGAFTYERGSFLDAEVWRLYVVDKKSDGSWQILLRQTTLDGRAKKGEDLDAAKAKLKQELDEVDLGERSAKNPRTFFGRLEINTRGQISNSSLPVWMHPPLSQLLLGLPQTPQQLKDGWTTEDSASDQTLRSHLQGGPSTGIDQIETTIESTQNDVYEIVSKMTTRFDRSRGLPVQITTDLTQGFGIKGTSNSTIDLVDVKSHSVDWAKRFATEADACLAVIGGYEQICDRRELDSKELKEELTKQCDKLEQQVESLQTDELKGAMSDQANKCKQEIEYRVSSAESKAAMIGQASLDWETTDLVTGKDCSLKDFRGKVVVLDFWYRGCGWCIRAMPQVKEVSQHFKNQPVVVLGMNKHDTLEVAQLVIDKLKLDYPQLKADKISNDYKIRGFPTLLVLDQEGVVRDVHVGYSPTLKEHVIQSIESLTKAKQP